MELAQLNANLLVWGIVTICLGFVTIFILRKVEYIKTTKEYDNEIKNLKEF